MDSLLVVETIGHYTLLPSCLVSTRLGLYPVLYVHAVVVPISDEKVF